MVVEDGVATEVYPLLWSDDVDQIVSWAQKSLGLTQIWSAADAAGRTEHAELRWPGGRISVNIKQEQYRSMGPSGIALRVDDRDAVDAALAKAEAAGAQIVQGPQETSVAYSFTALDPDGNQWWVNAETGMLDQLRSGENVNDAQA